MLVFLDIVWLLKVFCEFFYFIWEEGKEEVDLEVLFYFLKVMIVLVSFFWGFVIFEEGNVYIF